MPCAHCAISLSPWRRQSRPPRLPRWNYRPLPMPWSRRRSSTREFGSLLSDIFEPRTHAHFEWDGWARLRDQLVMAFHYSVEQANSQWGIEYEKKEHIVPAYSGRILIDKDTHVVLRVTLNAD